MPRLLIALAQVLLVSVVLPAGPVAGQERSYAWTSAETHEGIQLFTSTVARHNYDAVKATAVIPAAAAKLVEVLRAFERYASWYYRVAQVRVLSEPASVPNIGIGPDGRLTSVPTSGPWVLFLRQRTPPLDDRWTLLRCAFRAGPRGSLLVEFHSLDQAYAGPEDAVRMDLRGYWHLQPLDPARTEVTFMIDVDPRTAVPAVFVDPELRAAVVETMQSLRKLF